MFQVKPSIHISLCGVTWVVIFEALFGCHDVLILGKSPIKGRQCPDMTTAVGHKASIQTIKQMVIYYVPSQRSTFDNFSTEFPKCLVIDTDTLFPVWYI